MHEDDVTAPAGGAPADPPGGVTNANAFGLGEALIGLAVAEVLASAAAGIFAELSGHPHHPSQYGTDLAELVGIWIGFFGAVLVASARHRSAGQVGRNGARHLFEVDLASDFGLALRPWPDIPLGVAAGLVSQYVLVPYVFEVPLLPFVPHLYERLGGPANEITGPAHGAFAFAVLGLFVCVGSPFFEECFFRGLLLRAVVGRLVPYGRRLAEVGGVLISAVVFGLVHFEALQLIGLAGFGVVLAVLARRTGRLGPGIVAHVTFNAVTVISLALARG